MQLPPGGAASFPLTPAAGSSRRRSSAGSRRLEQSRVKLAFALRPSGTARLSRQYVRVHVSVSRPHDYLDILSWVDLRMAHTSRAFDGLHI